MAKSLSPTTITASYEPKPVAIPAPELALMVEEAGATLQPSSSVEMLADELAYYAEFLTRHPQALDANARNLATLTSAQRKALSRLRDSLEEAAGIFISTKDTEWMAGRRWLFALNQFREAKGWPPFLSDEIELLLAQMHLCAIQALNAPEAYFRHYVLGPGPASERILERHGEEGARQMIEDARDLFNRKPENRALLFIGRAIGCHIADSLMGTVDPTYDPPRVTGAALLLGAAIAERWGVFPAPGTDALRSTWRRLPEKLRPRP